MAKYLRRSGLILVLLVFVKSPLRAGSIQKIVAKAKPAIVEIVTTDAKGTPKRQSTGFFVSPNGLVMTNRHEIEGAGTIAAVNINGAIFLFERMVAEPASVDLAILKFRANDVPLLTLGKSTTAVEGQKVIVIGNPRGLTGTVSDGIIFAFRENRSLIQITALISPGSSGSPVMDEKGQVIGVAKLQSVEGQNLNFAIAVEKVSAALTQSQSEQLSGSAPSRATPTPAVDAKAYFERGEVLYGKKLYEDAISGFSDAIRLDPNFGHAYYGRGVAYYEQGKFEKAISDYTEAIRLDPNFANAFVERGNAYNDKGKLDEAISDYNDAIRLDPNFGYAYNNRGNAYYKQGKFDKAISDYTEMIRLDPNHAEPYHARGQAYYKQGNFDKAISDFTEAIRLDPNDFRAYYNRGLTYSNQGNLDSAISDYTAAIRLNPNYAVAYNDRGLAHFNQGNSYSITSDSNPANIDSAIRDFSEVLRLNPNDAVAYDDRGLAYAGRGDLDKTKQDFAAAIREYRSAIGDYSQAIRIDPNNARAYYNRGIMYSNLARDGLGYLDSAIGDFTEAIRLNPNDADAYNDRGSAYARRGDLEKAKADYATANRLKGVQ